MGEPTVADTHNDSFRMPLREPRPGTRIEPKGGPTNGYPELFASSATLRTRLWPGWQPATSTDARELGCWSPFQVIALGVIDLLKGGRSANPKVYDSGRDRLPL